MPCEAVLGRTALRSADKDSVCSLAADGSLVRLVALLVERDASPSWSSRVSA
jgi:hypothetical protein